MEPCAWASTCWDCSLSMLGFHCPEILNTNLDIGLNLQDGVKLKIVFHLSGWVVDRDLSHSKFSGVRGMLLESQLCKIKHLWASQCWLCLMRWPNDRATLSRMCVTSVPDCWQHNPHELPLLGLRNPFSQPDSYLGQACLLAGRMIPP